MTEWQHVLIDQDVDAAIQVMRQTGQTHNDVLRKMFGLSSRRGFYADTVREYAQSGGIAKIINQAIERTLTQPSLRLAIRVSFRVINPRDPKGRAYRAVLVEGKQVVWACPHTHRGFRPRQAALACAERERRRRMQEGT